MATAKQRPPHRQPPEAENGSATNGEQRGPDPEDTPTVPLPMSKDRTPDEKRLIEALLDTYQMAGMVLIGVGMRIDDQGLTASGMKTLEMAPTISDAWIDLSRRNPAVKAALKRLTEVSAGGIIIGYHFSIAAPYLASRGIVPANFAPAPDVHATDFANN